MLRCYRHSVNLALRSVYYGHGTGLKKIIRTGIQVHSKIWQCGIGTSCVLQSMHCYNVEKFRKTGEKKPKSCLCVGL